MLKRRSPDLRAGGLSSVYQQKAEFAAPHSPDMPRRWQVALRLVAAVLLLAGPSVVLGQASSTAAITGVIIDGNGVSLHGATVVARRIIGESSGSVAPPQTAISDSNGGYGFKGLPPGLYRVCGSVPSSNLLDPCEWFPNPPAAFVQAGQTVTGVLVMMQYGKLLNVRLDDSQKVLKANAQGAISSVVIVRAISPSGSHDLVKVAEDASGENHMISIPIGVPLKLDVWSPTLSVKGQGDASGVNISEGTTPSATPGGAAGTNATSVTPSIQPFQVSANDLQKQYRFVVQTKGN